MSSPTRWRPPAGRSPPELDELAEAPGVMRTRFTEVGKDVDPARTASGRPARPHSAFTYLRHGDTKVSPPVVTS